ncbi:MAG: 4Fe-4S binding protein [Eubacteriales bacterium]|nr:4Fe-4S binding protein [Eubacteriales bacterium]
MATYDIAALKKGGFMKQKQKGKFSLRLGIVGGQVTAEQLAAVLEVANRYGHGYVHLTARQGIEIPFIDIDQIEEVKAALAKGHIAPGVCGPRVRTITACQGMATCPNGCIDTEGLAKELNDRYFGRELPHKFKFGVTGCQNNCLKAEENDLGIKGGLKVDWQEDKCISCGVCAKTCRTNAITLKDGKITIDPAKCNFCGRCAYACPTDAYDYTRGYILTFGGNFGNNIAMGEPVIPFIEDHDKLMAVCDATIKFFAENAKPSERFAFTLKRVGFDKLAKVVREAYESA